MSYVIKFKCFLLNFYEIQENLLFKMIEEPVLISLLFTFTSTF